MIRSRSAWSIVIPIGTVLLLSSCAGEPPLRSDAASPNIQLGPELKLLEFRTTSDHTATLLDEQGHAHVFIAAASTREVHHVVVSPAGTVQRESIETGSSPSTISAAFDRAAGLHLLLDDRHLLREGATWQTIHDTPWEAAGIEIHRPGFVPGNSGLVWAFLADGKEVGARGRWDWYGFGGGFGAGIIFPWHSASQKLVMVPEAGLGEPLWYVLDPQDNLDTFNAMPALDDHGNLHIVYEASRSGLAASGQPRFARIDLLPPSSRTERRMPDDLTGDKRLYPVIGDQIPFFRSDRFSLNQAAASVDPAGGTVLVVRAHDTSTVMTHGDWNLPIRLPVSSYWEPKLSPAGGGAFHLLTVADTSVLYLFYAQNGWSAPVTLGQSTVASALGAREGALGIASHGHNRAFAVWPTETGIVGRWIEWTGEIPTEPEGRTNGQQGDEASIPNDLLDFARGKAELTTPGWTSGFAAATAAGTNGKLNKSLHDNGRWESLARVVLNDSYGDDLRWYYLGRAAEGMALCDTALHYYKISQERSERLETRCLSFACTGIEVPDTVRKRLIAVDAMRVAGKCRRPE